MILVTAGAPYLDIDAYAGCVAYAELLRLLGKEAIAISTAPWNASITRALRALHAPLQTQYQPNKTDSFVLVDLSNSAFFDTIVDLERVIEIFDHHTGFEDYWSKKLGKKSHIEFIGAAATLIYEQWLQAAKLEAMSRENATLLAAAILDNTLNFGADITNERDKEAYKFLASHASLDNGWIATYFLECQAEIMKDLPGALRNDTKFLQFKGLRDKVYCSQQTTWDAEAVIAAKQTVIADMLSTVSTCWLANIISISEKCSYFLSDDQEVQGWLQNLLGVKFKGTIARADRLWLRKEIMKIAQV